jgi:pimeloyl-ACP methyl ester carboxylesterase
MPLTRRIYPTRYGQVHVRSSAGKGVPLVLLHSSPRCGEMWEALQDRLGRPSYAPDRLGYGFSEAPPWALSMEQYAQATAEALRAAGLTGPFDVLGMHAGSMEAIELAHQMAGDVRRVAAVGMPLFTPEEQQRQLERYSEQPLRPASEGGHILGAWRGCFAFRAPPYDLSDVHRRFVEHLLSANPGAALRAVCGYPVEKKLRSLEAPLLILAPYDDLREQTERVKPLLKPEDAYFDLPAVAFDPFLVAVERMAELLKRHLPAQGPVEPWD